MKKESAKQINSVYKICRKACLTCLKDLSKPFIGAANYNELCLLKPI